MGIGLGQKFYMTGFAIHGIHQSPQVQRSPSAPMLPRDGKGDLELPCTDSLNQATFVGRYVGAGSGLLENLLIGIIIEVIMTLPMEETVPLQPESWWI